MMMKLFSSLKALLAAAVLIGLSACGTEETTTITRAPAPSGDPQGAGGDQVSQLELRFGVYTSDKATDMINQFRPALDQLELSASESLKRPVVIKMEVANTYEKGIQNLVDGSVDISQLGPASYITAKEQNPDLSIIAIESKGGKKEFFGVFCVKSDSPIQSVPELAGKTFAFGSELSTIGRYLSQEFMLDHGVKASDLGRFAYLGRHDKVGTSVGLGDYDGGVLKEGTFKKLVQGGTEIREIARFPNVTKPWVARSGLDEDLLTVLEAGLIGLEDEAALSALRVDGFLKGADSDYARIRKSMERNGAFFE